MMFYLGYFIIMIVAFVWACIKADSKSCWILYVAGVAEGLVQVMTAFLNDHWRAQQILIAYFVIAAIGMIALIITRHFRKW